MHIRPLQATDVSAFQAFRLYALQESPTAFSANLESEQKRTLDQTAELLMPSEHRTFLGAFDQDETLQAMIAIGHPAGQKQRHVGFIGSMYVRPEARGAGLAGRLLQEALKIAGTWPEVRQITLSATEGNAPALALYRRAGFEVYGCAPQALCVEGRYLDEVLMVRHQRVG